MGILQKHYWTIARIAVWDNLSSQLTIFKSQNPLPLHSRLHQTSSQRDNGSLISSDLPQDTTTDLSSWNVLSCFSCCRFVCSEVLGSVPAKFVSPLKEIFDWEGFSYDAFIVMTIPAWQCFPCAQYKNIGAVLFTVIVKVVTMLWFAIVGTKPLWSAFAIGSHGESNADCVTVWFLSENWNSTLSPGWVVTSWGVKMSREVLLEPTTTVWVLAFGALGASIGT